MHQCAPQVYVSCCMARRTTSTFSFALGTARSTRRSIPVKLSPFTGQPASSATQCLTCFDCWMLSAFVIKAFQESLSQCSLQMNPRESAVPRVRPKVRWLEMIHMSDHRACRVCLWPVNSHGSNFAWLNKNNFITVSWAIFGRIDWSHLKGFTEGKHLARMQLWIHNW